jgi:hypothetical protein
MSKELKNLFKWNRKLEILDNDNKLVDTIYIRLVGDVDYNIAQQYALLASRKMRKALNDKESIEYQSLFFDADEKSKEELTFNIITTEIPTFRDQVISELGSELTYKEPELGDNPTLEEREKEQASKEVFEKERIEKIQKKLEEKAEVRKKELESKELESLRSTYISSGISAKCIEEFSTIFREYCSFAGSYSDNTFKVKVFPSFEDFRDLAPTLKQQIMEAYLNLEMTGEDLKN